MCGSNCMAMVSASLLAASPSVYVRLSVCHTESRHNMNVGLCDFTVGWPMDCPILRPNFIRQFAGYHPEGRCWTGLWWVKNGDFWGFCHNISEREVSLKLLLFFDLNSDKGTVFRLVQKLLTLSNPEISNQRISL